MPVILLADARSEVRRRLRDALSPLSVEVEEAGSLADAARARAHPPDLTLVGPRLDDATGLTALRAVRERTQAPTVAVDIEERRRSKLQALAAGAVDWIVDPTDAREVRARVRALLQPAPVWDGTIEHDGLRFDLATGELVIDGAEVHLTPTERALLRELVAHPGRLLTHEQLLQRVWGPEYGRESHYLRVYMAALRRKIGDEARRPRCIRTEAGIGHRWIGPAPSTVGKARPRA